MRYAFARCTVDTSTREVILGGAPVALSPKAFELLRLLIEARPRVVPKAEVMQALWPDTFVQEANVPMLIREARVAIGDAQAARVIKTHHRVGYAFTAEVRESRSVARRPAASGHTCLLALPDRRVMLSEGENTVGRHTGCDVQVSDVSVSRMHARIIVDDGSARVEDLHSKNGTRVGGVMVSEPTILGSGEVVTFGTVETRFLIEPSAETATRTV